MGSLPTPMSLQISFKSLINALDDTSNKGERILTFHNKINSTSFDYSIQWMYDAYHNYYNEKNLKKQKVNVTKSAKKKNVSSLFIIPWSPLLLKDSTEFSLHIKTQMSSLFFFLMLLSKNTSQSQAWTWKILKQIPWTQTPINFRKHQQFLVDLDYTKLKHVFSNPTWINNKCK